MCVCAAELGKIYLVISILLRCCDISHMCNVLLNKSQPMPNPFALVAPAERPESPTHASPTPSFLIPHSRLQPIDRPFLMRIPQNFEDCLLKPLYARLFLNDSPIRILLYAYEIYFTI